MAQLHRLGLTYRQLGERIGKSPVWVSQRIAISKLPECAIDLLNQGGMTREEALALTKLAETPVILEECLEPGGRALRMRLGGQVPESIGERVQAVLRVNEQERHRAEWANRLRAEGHRVLDQAPRDDDHRYVRLPPESEVARIHHESRLKCDAWASVHGRSIRYCTDPSALRAAMTGKRPTDALEAARLEEQRRALEREAARDTILGAWLATSRGLEGKELLRLARERIRTLTTIDDRVLVRLGGWLGCTGDKHERIQVAEEELVRAGERRYLQIWFLLEVAHSATHSIVPNWALPWLVSLGFNPSNGSALSEIADVPGLEALTTATISRHT